MDELNDNKMLINTNDENFVPLNFEILDFYGEDMCFVWNGKNIVIFPYGKSTATSKIPVIVGPREIKSLRCFDGRIFALCKPGGIFKIMRTYKFLTLSSTGIANGPAFYEVFNAENNWLCLQNKSSKVNRLLFRLEESNGAYNLCDLTLNIRNSERSLRSAIRQSEEEDEDVCVVSNNKKLFKITQSDAQLIYECQNNISDIVGIFRGEIIVGFVLVTVNTAFLAYVTNSKLCFDRVFFNSEIRGLCAGMSDDRNVIWLAHIDSTRIHYWTKNLRNNAFQKVKMEYANFLAIRNYKSKSLICLSDTSQLVVLGIDHLKLGKNESDEFFPLRPDMMRGAEDIVDAICERSKELQFWNEQLILEQNKLKRINIYSHKQKILHLPDYRVKRIAGRLFTSVKCSTVLPMNCHVVAVIRTDQRMNYCVKFMQDFDTTTELNMANENVDSSTKIRIDLVTLAQESKPWCLVRNYTRNLKIESDRQVTNHRAKFLRTKLAALRNLTNEGGVDMKKLTALKKSLRREVA